MSVGPLHLTVSLSERELMIDDHTWFRCRSWKIKCGYGPYVDLMDNYPLVTQVYLTFDANTRAVIHISL